MHCNRRRMGLAVAVAMLLSLLVLRETPSRADLIVPKSAPLDRLLPNLEKYVAEHPQEADGWFRLGRAHAMAFVNNSTVVRPPLALEPMALRYRLKDSEELTAAARRQHLEAAVNGFNKALELNPKSPLYLLSRAYLAEQAVQQPLALPPSLPEKPVTAETAAQWEKTVAQLSDADGARQTEAYKALAEQKGAVAAVLLAHIDDENEGIRAQARALLGALWREAAIVDLWQAYALSVEKDMKQNFKDVMELMDMASYQAGRLYVALVRARPMSAEEEKRVAQVTASVKHFDELPQGGISPIVFSLTTAKTLAELVDPHCTVNYDLDGDLVAERRTWLQADTAILCWDPGCTGEITSGRQLFGNVTFWIFWNNGYEALDALDDNRDRQLTGAELTGLAVWRDANQNGVSDPGEVEPVVNVGIDAIACRASETEDGCPANQQGLHLTDDRTLPTYDWYAATAPAVAGTR